MLSDSNGSRWGVPAKGTKRRLWLASVCSSEQSEATGGLPTLGEMFHQTLAEAPVSLLLLVVPLARGSKLIRLFSALGLGQKQ